MTSLPSKIGKYTIKSCLGEGSMGIVYKGYDPDIERTVAIKTIKTDTTDEQASDFLARFKREAQSVAKCTHQNIVQILEYGTQDGTPFMVMEYIEGWSLQEFLKQKTYLPLKNCLVIASKLLQAMQYAHKENIVHRDIKPANIMITKKGEVKLTDFGIARQVTKSDLTQVGLQVGTPAYMAPEQLVGDKADARSDIYALSIVLFSLLTKIPSNTLNSLSTINTKHGLSLHSQINKDTPIPSLLVTIIEKGLQIRPENRYQSANLMLKDLISVSKQLNLSVANKNDVPQKAIKPEPVSSINKNTSFNQMTQYGTSHALIDAAKFEEMSIYLEKIIGDDARNIIRDEMAMNLSKAEAIYAIAQHIKKPKQQTKFINRWSD